jgi:DNA-binding NarL/FixJ family response regulator
MAPTEAEREQTVLIVEDDEVMRTALREFVQKEWPRLRILEAADGARAIESCLLHRPSVVLMDINLPDANGIELTAAIRKRLPGLRVIVASSHDNREYRERASAAGAMAYVAKERVHEELLPLVLDALERPDGGIEES